MKLFTTISTLVFLISSVGFAENTILTCLDKQRHKAIVVKQMTPEDHKQAQFLQINYFYQQMDGYLFYRDGEIIRDSSGQISKIELKTEDSLSTEKWSLDVASGKVSLQGVWSHWNSDDFISNLSDLHCQSL